jgi:adenylate cyclase
MFSLSFVDSGTSRSLRLREGLTIVGRAPGCDLVINHPTVSRQHARVRFEAGRCYVTDAGSRYGTRVNGSKLDRECELVAGDVVTVGAIAITIEQRVPERELLSDGHQLLEESETVIRHVTDAATDGGRFVKLLTEIAKTLVAVQPVNEMLGRVVDLVFEVVPAERVFLLLRDSPDEPLAARVMRNRDRSVPGRTSLSRSVVNRVVRERVAMLGSDEVSNARLDSATSLQSAGARSFMCAPLWNRSDVIGVIYCDNSRGNRFGPDDLDVFKALCSYAAVAIEQGRRSAQLVEEVKRRERLQRCHSPTVVNRILHGGTGTDAPFLAQEREVTVMFCDLVAFSSFAQRHPPLTVAAFLNSYFTRMADLIFEHEGTLDKFFGDALLAVFGAPFEQPDHAARAVAAARDIRRALASMNAEPGATVFQMRIALNTGRALTGDIGSPRRREFTALGEAVHMASRVESVAEPNQILLTGSTWAIVKDQFKTRKVETNTFRGSDLAMELYELTE